MKSRIGKITIAFIILLVLVVSAVFWAVPEKAEAATWPTTTISIHKNIGSGFTTIDNAYAIISPVNNCDMYDSTGAANATYASAAITFTADGQYTAEALGTIPPLPKTISEWEITFYENSSPAATDAAVAGPYRLNPKNGMCYSDANPTNSNEVLVR
jgi:hypothetical protein